MGARALLARRVRGRKRQIERQGDERLLSIAKLAYRRGEYGYTLFGD